ncbi:MAG TPA: NAD-dependent epimerase/dehydratase family protein [Xylella sp.]
MNSSGKRVLLTGSSGFTGRYMLNELLDHGYEVIALGKSLPEAQDDSVRWVQADLCDIDALIHEVANIRPDIVIHLAALTFVAHGSANDFYHVNLIGTRNLLTALTHDDATPDCVLLASSANVYGNVSEGVLDESTVPAPTNDYAVSKLSMEYMAHLWRERLPLVVTRPFNYTGVGQADNFLIPKIVAHFCRRSLHIELGNLDVQRDFSDVRSVVQAYRRLVEATNVVGKTVNVCSGVASSLRDVIDLCTDITAHTIAVGVNPAFVRTNEVRVLRGNHALLRQLIGPWSSPPLRETLEWMLESFPR